MTPLNIALRSSLAFVVLWVVTRLLGKKQLSQLTFFEYVSGITIGVLTASAAIDSSLRPVNGVLALLTFMLWTIGHGFIALKSYWGRKIIEGEPTVLIQNGKILEGNMNRIRFNVNELMMELREKNVFDIGQVEFALLEPNGKMSVLKRSDSLPITPKDIGASTRYRGMASEIIVDGQVLEQNLEQNNLNRAWLLDQLKLRGINDPGDVLYAELDTGGSLYVDTRDDSGYQQRIEDFPR